MSQDERGFELSRRNALAGLGTMGGASAGAGLDTSAFFSDDEGFENNQLTAPFALREPDTSDGSPGSFVAIPSDSGAVSSGNTIMFGLTRSVVGSQFKPSARGSIGGAGPVVEVSTDSDNSPELTDSSDSVQISEPWSANLTHAWRTAVRLRRWASPEWGR